MSCKIITVTNQKGGVAKTTTTASLAVDLYLQGYKVLAIDLDPQGNLSENFLGDYENCLTIYDVLKGKATVNETKVITLEGIELVPANISLSEAEYEISAKIGKEYILKEALENVKKNYDYIIIDTPPALSILTLNALTAANYVIIPTMAGKFATDGIMQLYGTVITVKKYYNDNLQILGILLTRFNRQTKVGKAYKEALYDLANALDTKVFETCIRSAVAVEEAQTNKKSIFAYAINSTVAEDYKEFTKELLG